LVDSVIQYLMPVLKKVQVEPQPPRLDCDQTTNVLSAGLEVRTPKDYNLTGVTRAAVQTLLV